jgi:hypothetical protein
MFLGSISLDSIANGITTWWFQHFNPNRLFPVGLLRFAGSKQYEFGC